MFPAFPNWKTYSIFYAIYSIQLFLGLQNRDVRLYKCRELNKKPPKGKFPGRGGI